MLVYKFIHDLYIFIRKRVYVGRSFLNCLQLASRTVSALGNCTDASVVQAVFISLLSVDVLIIHTGLQRMLHLFATLSVLLQEDINNRENKQMSKRFALLRWQHTTAERLGL
jgi:hypothetical protein